VATALFVLLGAVAMALSVVVALMATGAVYFVLVKVAHRRNHRRGKRRASKLVKIDIGWCKDRFARICTRAANIVMLRNYADLRRGTPAN
jgi:heme/copper-type cytochrome/quinol oxidase subunit 2